MSVSPWCFSGGGRSDLASSVQSEIATESYPELNRILQQRLPGCVATPMHVYGRAVGFIVTRDSPDVSLESLADECRRLMQEFFRERR